ncbi:hypothetical protein BLNAU_14333 [Blattamonas nauphoetae]|uniref:Uncharacterized protein n=1 Tax=Blattamonas nauphoetae TaxID=2049346 RepID=A0ABQ9XDX5_9EUKA|nr:hypothetical protein BLNAU_14333 [Blattamonas nauphoetae]
MDCSAFLNLFKDDFGSKPEMNSRLETTINSTENPCPDCSPFLNWSEKELESIHEKAVVFRSLVATLKLQPVLDDSLEDKAVKFLESVNPKYAKSADAFLSQLASASVDSLTDFVQCIGMLLSSPSQVIISASMKMLKSLIWASSADNLVLLVKSDLIPQVITILNPQSLSFAAAEYIHICLMTTIRISLWFATPRGLTKLELEDDNEHQAVRETVLKQVLLPTEQYIWHLCVKCSSIVDGEQSKYFLTLLARLLRISPYDQSTMDFVLQMPVTLTIPSCLTFFEDDESIWTFLDDMVDSQLEWNKEGGEVRQIWKTVHRMLRMEGIEDVIDEKLRNDKNETDGYLIVEKSIKLNNLQGINIPELCHNSHMHLPFMLGLRNLGMKNTRRDDEQCATVVSVSPVRIVTP